MPIEILMPALSPTMTFGTLRTWHVKVGDSVEIGDILVEIETDKATMEVEAVEEGTIVKILIDEGTEEVPVNAPIALLRDGHEDSNIDNSGDHQKGGANSTVSASQGISLSSVKEKDTIEEAILEEPGKPDLNIKANHGHSVKASPLARRLASQHGLDLGSISGTGPRNRVIKRDIEETMTTSHVAHLAPTQAKLPSVTNDTFTGATQPMVGVSDKEIFASYSEDSYELIPHSNMRKTVAERLTIAKASVPHFYLTVDCLLDDLLSARKRLNDVGDHESKRQFKLSVNDFIVKALALALQDVPSANASWSGQGVLQHKRSDVCVAVAVEGGLFTPVVRHADLKTLSEISNEVKDLAQRARAGKLKPTEYIGGSSTISNLGMYGIKQFDAVINPPQATILAVGQGREQPVAVNGSLTVATVMSVSLSCDHRVVDGALGAQLLDSFKGYIEDPVKMLV